MDDTTKIIYGITSIVPAYHMESVPPVHNHLFESVQNTIGQAVDGWYIVATKSHSAPYQQSGLNLSSVGFIGESPLVPYF